jgi:hypothetical protein
MIDEWSRAVNKHGSHSLGSAAPGFFLARAFNAIEEDQTFAAARALQH